jgi:hypothetical protein
MIYEYNVINVSKSSDGNRLNVLYSSKEVPSQINSFYSYFVHTYNAIRKLKAN